MAGARQRAARARYKRRTHMRGAPFFAKVKKTGVRAVRAVRRLYGRVFRHYRDAAVVFDAHDARNFYLF